MSILSKKKILILISHGGGGHQTAGESLRQILETQYDVEVNSVISGILGSLDPINVMTFGRFNGEDVYNFFLRKNINQVVAWISSTHSFFYPSHLVEKQFRKYLQQSAEPRDLIISVTPYVNYGIACAAHSWNIPLLVVPTDLDGSSFLTDFFKQPHPCRFKVALAYDDPEIREITFQDNQLSSDQLVITGFPIRPSCCKQYSPEDLSSIRERFHLLESHKTVTLIMGAQGTNHLLDLTRILTQLDLQKEELLLQINICVGKNQKIANKVERFLLNQAAAIQIEPQTYLLSQGLIIHVRRYVEEIIELMSVSDLIITKTGSCTFNEAIYLGKIVLLDNTKYASARYLPWEKFNLGFARKHHLGFDFSHPSQLLELVPSVLKAKERPQHNLQLLNFKEQILKTVNQMTALDLSVFEVESNSLEE